MIILGLVNISFGAESIFFFNSGFLDKVSDIRNPSGTVLNLTPTDTPEWNEVNMCLVDGSSGNINMNSNLIENFNIGNSSLNRYFINMQDITVSVCSSGCNYTTIQEAVDNLPLFLMGQYTVNVHNGDYSTEGIVIRGSFGINSRSGSETSRLVLTGNITNPGEVKIGSIFVIGLKGRTNIIEGFNFTSFNSFTNENASLDVDNSDEVVIRNSVFSANGYRAIISYGGSNVKVAGNVNFGTGLYNFLAVTKHGSKLYMFDGNFTGSASEYAFSTPGGMIFIEDYEVSVTGMTGFYNRGGKGFLYSDLGTSGKMYGLSELDQGLKVNGNIELNNSWLSNDGGNEGIRVDDNGNVGINTQSPAGDLHVRTGSSGATVNTNADEMILEGSTSTGFSFLVPDANVGQIYWGSPSDNDFAWIYSRYNSGSPFMAFGISNSEKVRINGSGIKANDYYSGDGTQGMTGSCGSATTLTVKDGLITSCS